MKKLSFATLSLAAGLAFFALPSASAIAGVVSPVKTTTIETNIVPAAKKVVVVRRGPRCVVKRVWVKKRYKRVYRVVRKCW